MNVSAPKIFSFLIDSVITVQFVPIKADHFENFSFSINSKRVLILILKKHFLYNMDN